MFLRGVDKAMHIMHKLGHGNLVLITSTVQVELSKLNFNFDDIGNIFFPSFNLLRFLKIIAL